MTFSAFSPTPVVAMLNLHRSRMGDLVGGQEILTSIPCPLDVYVDGFGNTCSRLVVPAGELTISSDFVVKDSGDADPQDWGAIQHTPDQLPADVLIYLMGSRYCDTDRLLQAAWGLFGHTPLGWARVQAICDFVHSHLTYGYQYARANRTAFEAFSERVGVCRDFAHLAVALCRCMNIPARYASGYLSDIGALSADSPMDFHAWFEVYLGGRWHSFDARHNVPRIGRLLMATGRDATDTALTTAFGPLELASFKVHTYEIDASTVSHLGFTTRVKQASV